MEVIFCQKLESLYYHSQLFWTTVKTYNIPMNVRSWFRHYATNRKVTGSIPDEVIGFFQAVLWPWGRLSL
jgi:hypothetical protein